MKPCATAAAASAKPARGAAPHLRLHLPVLLLLLHLSWPTVQAAGPALDIPRELDPFLELLFETPDCEQVVSNADFLIVGTAECKPFQCAFPHQACMRKSSLINEDKANQCRDIPDQVSRAFSFFNSRTGF